MQTLTELQAAETATLERALQYERRSTALRNARVEIARLTPVIAHLREQQKVMNTVAKAVQSLDPELVGHNSFALRDVLLMHLGVAGTNVAGKLDKFGKQLSTFESDLPRLEAAVRELEG